MELNWDKYDCLITNEGSDADSAHHTAYFSFMMEVLSEKPDKDLINETINKFSDHTGYFSRHPTRTPMDFSRDQFTPFLALNVLSNNTRVNYYYNKVKGNYGFFFNEYDSDGPKKPWWNRDWLDPATRGLYLRSAQKKSLKLYLTDLHLFSSIVFRFLKVRNNPTKTADENLILHLIVAKLKHSTFISNFAWKFYFKYRPFGWKYAVNDYWSRNGTYMPGMVPVVLAALDKLGEK